MTIHVVSIKFSGNKHCFLTIEQKQQMLTSKTNNDQIPVYKCEYDDSCFAYFSFSGHVPLLITQELVYLNGLYAQKLGIKDEEEVVLQPLQSVSTASSVQVEPLSIDDWEIVESHAATIENHLLDQIRVVWLGQIIPVWVAKSVCLFLKVEKLSPEKECLILDNDTEVLVSPKILGSRSNSTASSFDKNMPRSHSESNLQSLDSLGVEGLSVGSSASSNSKSKSPSPRRRSSGKAAKRHKSNASDSEILRKRNPLQRQSSLVEKMIGFQWLNKWFSSYINSEDLDDSNFFKEKFVIKENHFVFRAQPLKFECDPEEIDMYILEEPLPRYLMPDSKEELPPLELFQPSIVFVNYKDIVKLLGSGAAKCFPNVFYAEIRKLSSPKETKDKNKNKTKSPEFSSESGLKKSPKKIIKEEGSELCCIVRVVTINQSTDLANEKWQSCAERLLSEQTILHGHVLLPELLRRLLKLEVTGRVWLQTVQKPPVSSETLQMFLLSIVPRRVSNSIVISAFKKWIKSVTADHPLVVYPGLLVKYMIFQGLHVEVQLVFTDPPSGHAHPHKYILLNADSLANMTLTLETNVKDEMLGVICPKVHYDHVRDFDPVASMTRLQNLGAVEGLAKTGIRHLETCLLNRPLSKDIFSSCVGMNHGILLISGRRGSGKTCLARALCRRMAEIPNMVFTKDVDCKPLRGKRVDSIQKILELVFDEAAWRQPSVVLLEDLHIIAGAATSPDAEATGEALYAARIAEVITSIIKYQIKNNTRVAVIATSVSQNALHPTLVTSRGIHFIQEVITIKPPNKKERKELILKMLESRENISKDNIQEIDIDQIVNNTEGFVARDLDNVINRAIHAKYLVDWKACSSGDLKLTDEEFSVALEGFKPASFRNVPLHIAEDLGWRDVGGLNETKEILVETLQWPTKYPALFANCPLRLRSGLLLYGAPGTGKTLIAGVVAKECGLNFISIKGPEVLSKYIGASEQAVRDLFIRAQSAKPCILFFDEFDSMAPRRGHDNTGVTDRVVNQLLTQLDGVEGLDGVYVLAATSRPDLIDGALLRPGRIDKCLNCGLPTEKERTEILEALTYKMLLHPDVDLSVIAGKCEHFTGADLKAVLYNAQLEAIHESTGFSLQDSFNDRVVKKRNSGKDNCQSVISEEVKSAIKTFKEGHFEIQPVEKDAMRRAISVDDKLTDSKPQRPMSFHGEETFQLVSTMPKVVAVIPRLDEGVKELSTEEEESVLSMVKEIHRRNNLKSQTKPERRESLHSGRQYPMIQVNQAQLLKAVYGMRPSVNEEERRKYQHIYNTFTAARSGNFSPGISKAGKKATMA